MHFQYRRQQRWCSQLCQRACRAEGGCGPDAVIGEAKARATVHRGFLFIVLDYVKDGKPNEPIFKDSDSRAVAGHSSGSSKWRPLAPLEIVLGPPPRQAQSQWRSWDRGPNRGAEDFSPRIPYLARHCAGILANANLMFQPNRTLIQLFFILFYTLTTLIQRYKKTPI